MPNRGCLMETAGLVRKGDPIAVVGGGLIGISWTALFLAWGHDVALFEHEETSRHAIPRAVARPIVQVAELMPGLPAPGRLHLAASLEEAVQGAAWIQENVPEKVPLKRAIYAAIDDRVEATAGALYDRATGSRSTTATADAPAVPSPEAQAGARELKDGLTDEQRRMLDELG